MKYFRIYLVLMMVLGIAEYATAQTVSYDISTGIYNGTNPRALQPIADPDDTWTCYYYAGTTTSDTPPVPTPYYAITYLGNGLPTYSPPGPMSSPYTLDGAVRWLAPAVITNPTDPQFGRHYGNEPIGHYYYKAEILVDCAITDAFLHFETIFADDVIRGITLNGFPVFSGVGYGFVAPGYNVTFPNLEPYIINGTNELIIHVENIEPITGLQLNGSLTVTYAQPDAGFCVNANGNIVTALGNTTSGDHVWEVSGSMTGAYGSFTPLGIYNTPSVDLNMPDYNCFLFKHKIEKECGVPPVLVTGCHMQSFCKHDCTDDNPPCDLPAPTGLNYTGGVFSWTPSSSVSSYEIEITQNDPSCCLGSGESPGGSKNTIIIPNAQTPQPWIPQGDYLCFSWRVKAFCTNGGWVYSEKKCGFYSIYPPLSPDKENTGQNNDQPKSGN